MNANARQPAPSETHEVAARRIVAVDRAPQSAREMLSELVKADPLALVRDVRSGREALEALREGACALLLIDLGAVADLAVDAGEAVARLARQASGALVIALSSGGSISVAMAAMRAGAHDFVARPIEPAAFALRVSELAARHGKGHFVHAQPRPVQLPAPTSEPAMQPQILPLWRQEQRIIEDAIRSFSGNIALAAAALELSPSTIYRKRQAWAEKVAE